MTAHMGQFGFVGLGAGVTGWLLTDYHASLLLCLLASTLVGTMVALIVGLPALRIRGLYLGVVTLGFAAPASTFFLNPQHFPSLAPIRVDPPVLFGRFDLTQPRAFYYVCLVGVLIALGVARNFRASRIGRASIALRDNERFAAAVSISAIRVRLTTFGVSGGLAGLAGGLYVLAYRGIPFGGFAPVLSLQAFTMVVVGGMGSLWGAVLGALYVYLAQYFLGATALLLVTGAGIIVVLTLAPGGLADLGYRVRDRGLRACLRRRHLPLNLLYARPDEELEELAPARRTRVTDTAARVIARVRELLPTLHSKKGLIPSSDDHASLLRCEQIEAGYGHLQILFGVDAEIEEREVFALLGTNGAGKSTILRVIAGLLPARRGRVIFAGENITTLSPAERVRRGLVLVPGGRGVFGTLTVGENLRLAAWLARRRHDTQFIDSTTQRVFELFPVLRERLDQRASLLSGGEQQMLTIAQALLCKPKLLMIDELSLGLAPVVVGTLLEALRSLNASGITVILVEQSMNIAAAAAPRAVFLEKGQVRFSGATRELADTDELVRSVFLGDAAARRTPIARSSNRDLRLMAGDQAAVPALEVLGVSKSYGGVHALTGVNLALHSGEILGVIGANGAGKTTLFDIISALSRPDTGRFLLHGQDVTKVSATGRAALGLGRTFQDLRLIPSMTVAEVLAVAHERHIDVREPIASVLGVTAWLRSEAALAAKVDDLLETFNLERYRNSFISELSTGTRRVVELASACAHAPSVLILDEPSSGLAQREAEAMSGVIHDIKERTGAAIAIIEHDIPMIKDLSDEVVCMHLGEVIARGTADAVLSDSHVVASYLGFDEVAVQRSGPTKQAQATTGRGPRTRGGTRSRPLEAATGR